MNKKLTVQEQDAKEQTAIINRAILLQVDKMLKLRFNNSTCESIRVGSYLAALDLGRGKVADKFKVELDKHFGYNQ